MFCIFLVLLPHRQTSVQRLANSGERAISFHSEHDRFYPLAYTNAIFEDCVLLLSDNRVSFLFLSFWATSSEFYCWPTAVSSFKTSILWVSTTSCPCYRAFQEIQFSLVLYWPSSIFQNNKKIKLSVGPEVSKTQKPSWIFFLGFKSKT